jgi:hypothetical protein
MSNFLNRVILLLSFAALAVSGAFSQVSFSGSIRQHLSSRHADFNSDGREDFISSYSGCANWAGFALALSTGPGTYATPVCYTLPAGSPYYFAVGDFNNDGNPDVIVGNGTKTLYEYVGSSTGALHLKTSFTAGNTVGAFAAADVNHDGKIDLLFITAANNLRVWFGQGNGSFSIGPSTGMNSAAVGDLLIGDFDGDGHADALSQDPEFTNTAQVFYGDGTGHFSASPIFADDSRFAGYDVNGDGKMDLITEPFAFSTNGSTYFNVLKVYRWNADRTFSIHQITLANCTVLPGPPAVADVNGDGRSDIVVIEGSDCQGHGPDTVNVLLRNPDGTYQPEKVVYTGSSGEQLNSPVVVRANGDTKPDIVVREDLFSMPSADQSVLLQNTTSGGFPSCKPPGHYTGIHVCSPSTSTSVSSPVKLSVGAANQTAGRKVEVWIDGKKMSEQFKHAFSNYSFLNASYNLSSGKHNVSVVSAGWDNLVEKVTFPLTVQ